MVALVARMAFHFDVDPAVENFHADVDFLFLGIADYFLKAGYAVPGADVVGDVLAETGKCDDAGEIVFGACVNSIDGFGDKYIRKFYDLDWLRTLADIYNLDYEAIATLEGFGQKSADKLKEAIEKAKTLAA